MKKLVFIFAFFYIFISCDTPFENTQSSILLFDSKLINNGNKLFTLQDLTESHKQESIILKNYSPYYNILRIFIFLIIIVFVLVIVSTPLLLVYFWINNFFDYQKLRIQIKKSYYSLKFIKVEESTWLNYKNIYSAMYGNGFGIIAWIFFTYLYISKYYKDFNAGLIDYFQFPFKIMDGFSNNNLTLNNLIPSEMWISMLLIVGASALHYFLGRYIGRLILTTFYKKTIFQITNNNSKQKS